MTTFAPTSRTVPGLAGLAPDQPHQEPPPPHLAHNHHHAAAAAFAHQLNAPTSPYSPVSPVHHQNSPRLAQRSSQDFRRSSASASTMPGANGTANANGNAHGPMPVPGGPHGRINNGNNHLREMGFNGPRSPPNNKSTSHVPCKFYRQGQCQAGKACPFLHSDEPLTERAPCKYFTKGNCKFGPKCALAHILPNGQVVNRHQFGNGGGPFGRMNITRHHEQAPGSSLLSIQANEQQPMPYDPYISAYDIPTIDMTFSHNGSNFGSPPNDSGRLPISPVQKGLSIMDVPLPASFDSQGISHMARYGPIAASVPSKISPPASYQNDSAALRNLHNSAFGDGKSVNLGSSPPDSVGQPVGRRIMHSEKGVRRNLGMISASVGAHPPMGHDEWDESELIGKFEEDLLPSSLNDLLTPQEKMRRFSRDQGEDSNGLSHRTSLSRLGASPTASDTKFGSPSAVAASPSRFQSLWGKPRPQEPSTEFGSLPGASAFGHVGSPLRNSSLHPDASPSMRAVGRPTSGEASPFLSSPPRHGSMSMLSQQMQRTRLTSRASEEGGLNNNPFHPGLTRVTSASSVTSSTGRLGMDRAVSSNSVGRERIEEEQGLFSMEEEDDLNGKGKDKDGASTTSSTSNKRLSGLSWGSGEKTSPNVAPSGVNRVGHLSGLGKDPGPWENNP
ncbi:hypothetical protein B0J11DRAFT_81378 [Dendryphion nanum]|uniref:C3H1-type domain-containing protein n=1 Tax=Dendryphion nanum TaxID=256645 RepID=A0A9P9IEL9_9PLEO|nr:hypothetical protein B0J11DRAFT_81378 [Dendryphion nanum]